MNSTGQRTYMLDDGMLHRGSRIIGGKLPQARTAIQRISESCSSDMFDQSTADSCCVPSRWSAGVAASDATNAHWTSEPGVLPQSGTVTTQIFEDQFGLFPAQRACDEEQTSHQDAIVPDASILKHKKVKPSRASRQRYHTFMNNVLHQILANPQKFDFDLLEMPEWLANNENAQIRLKSKFQELQDYVLGAVPSLNTQIRLSV